MKLIIFTFTIFGFLALVQCNENEQKGKFNEWINFLNTVGHSLSNLSRRQQNVGKHGDLNNVTGIDTPQTVVILDLNANENQNEHQTSKNIQSSVKRKDNKDVNSRFWKKFQRKLKKKTSTEKIQKQGNDGIMTENLQGVVFTGTRTQDSKDRREQRNNRRLRKLFKSSKYEGVDLNDYDRAEWRVKIPVNQFKDTKVREVAFYNRTKRQVTVITSSRYKKTGLSASTNMRDYKSNRMAIKMFTSHGLACFIGNIDKGLDDAIALIQQRNTSKELITLGAEINVKANDFKEDVQSIGETLLKFCSTRYGDVKLYTFTDYKESDPAEVKLEFPVYEEEVVYAGSSVRERLKVISLFGTFIIHL